MHGCAVGSVDDGASVSVAAGPVSAGLEAVVAGAFDVGVLEFGFAAVLPVVEVVDLGLVGADRAGEPATVHCGEARRDACDPGEKASAAANVGDDTATVEHDAADVAGESGAEHVVARHRDAGVGLAASQHRTEVFEVVGRVDQAVTGEDLLEGELVGDDVDDGFGWPGVGGCRGGSAEDGGQCVESALGVGAGEQRGGRVGAVVGGSGCDVGSEFAFDEAVEDLDQLRRDEGPAT